MQVWFREEDLSKVDAELTSDYKTHSNYSKLMKRNTTPGKALHLMKIINLKSVLW
jgi:hypothetical protein